MEAFFRQERATGAGGIGYWMRLVVDHARAALAVRRGEGDGMMRKGWEDLVAGARALARAPTFTLFAVVTLGLGIGATTAVFGVVDRVLLRPLPYPDSERMALVGIDARHDPGGLGPLSAALMLRLQEAPGPAGAAVGATSSGVVLQDGGEPERMQVTRVTRGFFSFFGAQPAAGRLLADADYEGSAPLAVLGHGFWRQRYGADPGVVGRSIRLDDDVYTVVGVLGPDFVAPPEITEQGDVWVPLRLEDVGERTSFFIAGAARLEAGTTLADLDAHADRMVGDVYAGEDFLLGATVASYRDSVVGSIGETLGRVMAAVALLLVIACVNVASLLLTRGTHRAQELAVRTALGARRSRLVRQLLSESFLIALAGAALGGGLAWGAVELFRRYAPAGLPRLEEVALDLRGLGFSLAVGMATVLVFGLLPALRSSRSAGLAASLTRRATAGRREGRLRGGLIALETALAVVLAVGSSLLAHDLVRLAQEDAGFRPDGLVAMRLDLTPRFGPEEWPGVWDRVLDAARQLPGVTAAALSTQAPYGGTPIASTFRPEGSASEEAAFMVQVSLAGDYAETLGTGLVEGRDLGATDDGAAPVALVNEALALRYWPGESAIGKHLQGSGSGDVAGPSYEVVGVLSDVRTHAGEGPSPHVFLPLRAAPWHNMEIMVRSEGDVAVLATALRQVVARVDPSLPVTSIRTVSSLMSTARARPRFYTGLFGGFAAVALLLAVVGVYGTTAYAMRSRVREIGIRLALGAKRKRVVAAMVARTGAVLAVGVAAGLSVAFLSSRALGDVLAYVTPRDSLTYAAVAAVVMAAGLVAAWIPAGRAGRIDPATTLRDDA
jgi:putative ABC transport system permease protein